MKVFDSSAVLAVVFDDEPGAEQAIRWLEEDDAVISSVNHAEVLAKMLDKGLSEADVAAITHAIAACRWCRSAPSRPASQAACGPLPANAGPVAGRPLLPGPRHRASRVPR